MPTTSSQPEDQQSVTKQVVVLWRGFLSDYNTKLNIIQDLNNKMRVKSYQRQPSVWLSLRAEKRGEYLFFPCKSSSPPHCLSVGQGEPQIPHEVLLYST